MSERKGSQDQNIGGGHGQSGGQEDMGTTE